MVEMLRTDYRTAPIGNQDRVMLDYVVKLTKDATQCGPDDIRSLRKVGFEDKAILQITLIASWFTYINKVADALGVGRGPMAVGERPNRLWLPRSVDWQSYSPSFRRHPWLHCRRPHPKHQRSRSAT